MESGFLGKQLLAACPPIPAARGWGWRRCQHPTGRETAEISRGGCVGWESFSGAWSLAGLTSKASLDVRRWRTTLIYSYSSFPYSCVAASPPAGPWKSSSVLPLDPARTAMLPGLLSSYCSQHSKTHIHNVLMVVGAEGRLGKHCPKCISAGWLCLIILFCGLFERTLFFSRVYPHACFLLLARFWSSTSEAGFYYYYYY